MDVELLVVPDCPNEVSAYELTRAALAELEVSASVTTTVIESDEQAQARGFIRSPTFLINGRDPFAEPGAATGVACRMYPTAAGLAGVPTLEELREKLEPLTSRLSTAQRSAGRLPQSRRKNDPRHRHRAGHRAGRQPETSQLTRAHD